MRQSALADAALGFARSGIKRRDPHFASTGTGQCASAMHTTLRDVDDAQSRAPLISRAAKNVQAFQAVLCVLAAREGANNGRLLEVPALNHTAAQRNRHLRVTE